MYCDTLMHHSIVPSLIECILIKNPPQAHTHLVEDALVDISKLLPCKLVIFLVDS